MWWSNQHIWQDLVLTPMGQFWLQPTSYSAGCQRKNSEEMSEIDPTFTVAIQCISAASAWTVASPVREMMALASSAPQGLLEGPCHVRIKGNTVSISNAQGVDTCLRYRNWESRHWVALCWNRAAFLKTCLQEICQDNTDFMACTRCSADCFGNFQSGNSCKNRNC